MGVIEQANRLEAEVRRQLAGVRLMGELEPALLTDARRCVRDLYGLGESAHQRWPALLSLAVVDIAAQESDGKELWPIVYRDLLKHAQPRPGEREFRELAGLAFEDVLAELGLPGFRHLREQGGRRFLAPILAHTVIPRKLIRALIQKVVGPLVDGDVLFDYAPADLRRRFERDPSIPVTVARFLFDGGPVARDLLERIILYVANDCMDPGRYGLPIWLASEIDKWAAEGRATPPRTVSRAASLRGPVLRYDDNTGQVQVELPYLEPGDDRWVILGDGSSDAYRAYEPHWRRDGPRQVVPLARPVQRLTVQLERTDHTTRTWTLVDGGGAALFFSHPSGHAVPPGGALHGDTWYVLRPAEVAIEGAHVLIHSGQPVGWDGWEADVIEASAGELLVAGARIPVASTPARARITGHPSAPNTIVPLDCDLVAAPGSYPLVCLPCDGDATGVPSHTWEVRCIDAAGREIVRTTRELSGTSDGRYVCVPLDQVLPPGAGTWDVTVRGRMGEGTAARVAVLPADWQGPQGPLPASFEGIARKASILTRSKLGLLQQGTVDRLTMVSEGEWLIEDADGNGRVAIAVGEGAAGPARVLLKFPTVRWRWADIGHTSDRRAFRRDELRSARLAVRLDGPCHLSLELRGPEGQVLQREETAGTVSAHQFDLGRFSTTAMALEAPARLVLRFRADGLSLAEEDTVGDVVLPAGVEALRVEHPPDEPAAFDFSWKQENAVEVRARLFDELCPWDECADEDVVRRADGYSARFYVQPGVYRLELWHDDPWSGAVCVHREPVEAGSHREQRHRFIGVSRDPARRAKAALSLALLESVGKESCRHLRGLTETRETLDVSGFVIDAFTSAIRNGVTGRMAAVPWWDLGAGLASAEFDAGKLVHAVAEAPPAPELRLLLLRLLVSRWRATRPGRLEIPDNLRSRLWTAFPPLGAMFDFNDPSGAGEGRLYHHLGLTGPPPRGPVGWAFLLDCDSAAPADVAYAHGGRPAETPGWPKLAAPEAEVKAKLGWNPGEVRRPHSAQQASLPSLSIVLACRERLIARGILASDPGDPVAKITGAVASSAPALFVHDLCVAEGIITSVFGKES